MRVAIVTESFLPTVNGVTTSVCRVLEHLRDRGHEAMVIAPEGTAKGPTEFAGFPIHRMPSVAYRQFPVGIPGPHLSGLIAGFAPDVLHAASPFILGAQAVTAAQRFDIPSVAVFQTDMAKYAGRNGLGRPAARLAWSVLKRIHQNATLTLVPSEASRHDLEVRGIERLAHWGRGVDSALYHPNRRADPGTRLLRAHLAADDEVIVGYVGRLAPEKEVHRLASLRRIPGMRLVLVGDGPARPALARKLAHLEPTFLGSLRGEELATAYAALDVFVHTGTTETFGQTIQEAHAAGLPVVAPNVGGPVDLVRHGEDGFLVDPRHDHAYRRAVLSLVSNAEQRARFGEAGRRAILGRTWEHLGDELIGHYQSVVGTAATRRSQEPANLSSSRQTGPS
ncbi:glycosyltransferase family 4 protein [Frondihabitans australicus]|uniref:D-inositol 3-phosphate glycosyltransferase n=1 Tax=Frondihabitans australicus TaxID=386892 RepID=A0A495IB11_9MICO|nr:glycosyltransferase family 1 protein [Frondihabitans australicus]RKR73193.1 phosphatidylinositol alpha 1,6-mannosyltransferase [Frondihabitans australicus]